MSALDRNGHAHGGDGRYTTKTQGEPGAGVVLTEDIDTTDGVGHRTVWGPDDSVAEYLGEETERELPTIEDLSLVRTDRGIAVRQRIDVDYELWEGLSEYAAQHAAQYAAEQQAATGTSLDDDQRTVEPDPVEPDPEAASVWLRQHRQGLFDASESLGARLELDGTEAAVFVVERDLDPADTLMDAFHVVHPTASISQARLLNMTASHDYTDLFESAERSTEDTRKLKGNLSAAVAMATAVQREGVGAPRYATLATRWVEVDGSQTQMGTTNVLIYDADARPITDVTVAPQIRSRNNGWAPRLVVPPSNPHEPTLLQHAQNSGSIIDLDELSKDGWG